MLINAEDGLRFHGLRLLCALHVAFFQLFSALYFLLRMMLQQSDGFSSAEIQEVKETFKKFDEDSSGDIDVCELSDMLRFQGHAASMDEALT